VGRWESYLRDIFRVIRPGGWCQMVELYLNCQSDNGKLTESRETSSPTNLMYVLITMDRSRTSAVELEVS
jgi:hypothetical protein